MSVNAYWELILFLTPSSFSNQWTIIYAFKNISLTNKFTFGYYIKDQSVFLHINVPESVRFYPYWLVSAWSLSSESCFHIPLLKWEMFMHFPTTWDSNVPLASRLKIKYKYRFKNQSQQRNLKPLAQNKFVSADSQRFLLTKRIFFDIKHGMYRFWMLPGPLPLSTKIIPGSISNNWNILADIFIFYNN